MLNKIVEKNNCTFVYNINDYSINEKQQFYITQYCQAQKALLASFQCSIYFWEYLFTILHNKIQQPSIKSSQTGLYIWHSVVVQLD